jgi:hypothetical protein
VADLAAGEAMSAKEATPEEAKDGEDWTPDNFAKRWAILSAWLDYTADGPEKEAAERARLEAAAESEGTNEPADDPGVDAGTDRRGDQ